MLYAKRFFPYYVYNILGGIEEDGEPPFLLIFLFRPRHRFWYTSAPYRIHSCSSTFYHCRPTIPFWATSPRNSECLPRCIRSRRMTCGTLTSAAVDVAVPVICSLAALNCLRYFSLLFLPPFSPFLSSSLRLKGVGSSCPISAARAQSVFAILHRRQPFWDVPVLRFDSMDFLAPLLRGFDAFRRIVCSNGWRGHLKRGPESLMQQSRTSMDQIQLIFDQ